MFIAQRSLGRSLASTFACGLALTACAAEDPDPASDPYADAVFELAAAPMASFGHDRLPEIVLGPPGGNLDVASLGCEGEIILAFDEPGILDGPGADLIVFENPFDLSFPEPGEVAVSEDGETWHEFPCDPVTTTGCAGVTPTAALPDSGIDPLDPELAGGDAFDLAALAQAPAQVFYVRIRDRSREYWEALGETPYCDPGQQGAGGFDLDAVAAVHGL
ncbi:cell surface protein [Pseudenhygromyxa sp. WMMC2535]|uniref:cell surface protein n=1 Tax=Pseudenhygromyxa sp. WMMC2535 TaxID=2712867 RepID=UPI00155204D9|nr:cell surface protein [Pseudenhygromyxa sp. WMMC2535]NVB37342.1 cell surface protein [Pseudenhygromyxa sp. WMMC2535]